MILGSHFCFLYQCFSPITLWISNETVSSTHSALCFLFVTLGDIGFSVPSYTFLENERIGRVTVNGPSNFPSTLSVQISGG